MSLPFKKELEEVKTNPIPIIFVYIMLAKIAVVVAVKQIKSVSLSPSCSHCHLIPNLSRWSFLQIVYIYYFFHYLPPSHSLFNDTLVLQDSSDSNSNRSSITRKKNLCPKLRSEKVYDEVRQGRGWWWRWKSSSSGIAEVQNSYGISF